MAFVKHEWELSNIDVSGEFKLPEEGLQYLQILDASYDSNNARYKLRFRSLTNDAEFSMTFFFADPNDDSIPPKLTNRKQMGTVASLGTALAGENIGIPNPVDIVGGVVMAEVSLREAKNGKSYPSIFKFEPVTRDIVDSFGSESIEQYATDDAPAEAVEEPAEE